MIIGSGVVHFTLSNPSLPRVFDLKSVPNNPNDDVNYKPGYGLGKELNFEIGLFRYFPANSDANSLNSHCQIGSGKAHLHMRASRLVVNLRRFCCYCFL